MKKSNIAMFCLMLLSNVLFAQQNIDFANYNTLEKVNAFFNDKSNKSDFAYGYYKTYEKGFWNGIPVENVVLRDSSIEFSTPSTLTNSTKKISEFLIKNYKENVVINKDYYETKYKINTEAITLTFNVDIDDNEQISEDTKGNMVIVFKEIIDNPLAKISSKIKTNPNGTDYFLDLDFFQVSPKILLNGIPIYQNIAKSRFINDDYIYLNRYILNSKNPITLKLIIEPGNDEDGKPYKTILKNSYIKTILESNNANGTNSKKRTIYDNKQYVTDTIIENGETRYSSYPGTYNYGKKNLEFEFTFIPQVDYEVMGWSNGKDLRKEKDLEQKIKKFYADFGDLIINKDINKITELLYDKYFEFYTANYNSGEKKSYDDYESWLLTIDKSFKTTMANETKLYISDDGKLAYLQPLDKSTNLKAVGRDYIKDIDFLFYIDEKTNQLKIIR